ncbi:uncharacterized protein GBIM_02590 [Gryllus bimaculatus]|nr:uncharacterized protein GBIM_02590 [Gryllus bimaculatus]
MFCVAARRRAFSILRRSSSLARAGSSPGAGGGGSGGSGTSASDAVTDAAPDSGVDGGCCCCCGADGDAGVEGGAGGAGATCSAGGGSEVARCERRTQDATRRRVGGRDVFDSVAFASDACFTFAVCNRRHYYTEQPKQTGTAMRVKIKRSRTNKNTALRSETTICGRTEIEEIVEEDDYEFVVLWFQQDSATTHTARKGLHALREMFPGRLVSLRVVRITGFLHEQVVSPQVSRGVKVTCLRTAPRRLVAACRSARRHSGACLGRRVGACASVDEVVGEGVPSTATMEPSEPSPADQSSEDTSDASERRASSRSRGVSTIVD